jgi:hypothetical protein
VPAHAQPEYPNDEPWIHFHRTVAGRQAHIVRGIQLRHRPLCGRRRINPWQLLFGFAEPGHRLIATFRRIVMCPACMDLVEE